MADERSRNQALAWLQSLSDKQFAEFFYEAVQDRCTSDFAKWQGHFVLADAEKLGGEPWDVTFLGVPSGDHEWAEDSPICQSGSCRGCGHPIRSWAKRAQCPICGAEVYCT